MNTFTQTFKTVIKNINAQMINLGFKLSDMHTSESTNSMAVFGVAIFTQKSKTFLSNQNSKFIKLGTAPLRLELDLDFGWGASSFSIHELYKLEGDFKFPERIYGLYEAMYDENQLQFEFERLIKIFELCGIRFLSDDKSLKQDLEEQRANRSEYLENEIILKKAEEAFKSQLWEEVVSLLSHNGKNLSVLNQKRLQYAKRKLKKTNEN